MADERQSVKKKKTSTQRGNLQAATAIRLVKVSAA